jgi:N-methylhydantoinase B
MRVFQSILNAFEKPLPHHVPAQGYDQRTELNLQWSGEGFTAISDQLGGGYGAGYNNDGADLIDDPLGNCKNSPAESLEIAQKYFRVTRYDLKADSGGAGKHRGGLGAVREYQILKDGVVMTVYSDRFKYPARGACGGKDGAPAYLTIHRADGTDEHFPSKGKAVLNKGDVIEMCVGGGAGYGAPSDRPREMIERDILYKKISAASAVKDYGYKEEK